MGYRVKGFQEVKQDSISLTTYINRFSPVVYGCYQLGLTRETLSKAMLLVDYDVVFSQVFSYMTEHHMLHYFTFTAGYTGRLVSIGKYRNWTKWSAIEGATV